MLILALFWKSSVEREQFTIAIAIRGVKNALLNQIALSITPITTELLTEEHHR